MIEMFKNLFAWVVEHVQGLSLVASIVLIVLLVAITVIAVTVYKRLKRSNDSGDYNARLTNIETQNVNTQKTLAEIKEVSELNKRKTDALLEALYLVYGTLKNDEIRKNVQNILVTAKNSEVSKFAELLNELAALKEKVKINASTIVEGAETVASVVTKAATGMR